MASKNKSFEVKYSQRLFYDDGQRSPLFEFSLPCHRDSNNIIVIIGIFTRYTDTNKKQTEQTAVYCGDCKFHKRSDKTLLTPPRQCFGINYKRHGRLTINAHHLTAVHVLIKMFILFIRIIHS